MVFPVNATLTFQVSTGEKEIDEFGNVRSLVQPLVVQCSLKERASNLRTLRDATNTDRASLATVVALEGRCVSPKKLPSTLKPGAKAQATIGGIEGTFTLEPIVQTAYTQVTEALGEKIRGGFELRSTYGERG